MQNRCPECQKVFSRPQAMGGHRAYIHDVHPPRGRRRRIHADDAPRGPRRGKPEVPRGAVVVLNPPTPVTITIGLNHKTTKTFLVHSVDEKYIVKGIYKALNQMVAKKRSRA